MTYGKYIDKYHRKLFTENFIITLNCIIPINIDRIYKMLFDALFQDPKTKEYFENKIGGCLMMKNYLDIASNTLSDYYKMFHPRHMEQLNMATKIHIEGFFDGYKNAKPHCGR